MTEWQQFLAAKRAGFTPPSGPGRCVRCGFHAKTQGHRDGCDNGKTRKAERGTD